MTAPQPLRAPFPWFGGKSRAAKLIWTRFGSVKNYIEPFAGSLAVLLANPAEHLPIETVNDKDAYLVNFWRAVQRDPDTVAHHADCPVFECDLHARHTWLHAQAERVERLKTDPDFYDPRVAGYWAWGLSSWIGDNFCRPTPQTSVPHLGNAGKGIHRQIPHLGDAGKGINRKLPHLGNAGCCELRRQHLIAVFRRLCDRLRDVRITCGDWSRVVTPSVTTKLGLTAVLLDPPYAHTGEAVYGNDLSDTTISSAVRQWASEHGGSKDFRIALCGYDHEHSDLLAYGWTVETWKAGGGYNNQTTGKNSRRERIWFSPNCIHPLPLFANEEDTHHA